MASITSRTAAELPYARDTSGRYDLHVRASLPPPTFLMRGETGIVAHDVSASDHGRTRGDGARPGRTFAHVAGRIRDGRLAGRAVDVTVRQRSWRHRSGQARARARVATLVAALTGVMLSITLPAAAAYADPSVSVPGVGPIEFAAGATHTISVTVNNGPGANGVPGDDMLTATFALPSGDTNA